MKENGRPGWRVWYPRWVGDDTIIVPIDDARQHEEDSQYCWCRPRVEVGEQGQTIIHNALDGREFAERGEVESRKARN